MDNIKKLKELVDLEQEPSLVLYEKVSETIDKLDSLTDKTTLGGKIKANLTTNSFIVLE